MTPEEKAKELINKFYQLRAYETMSLSGKRAAWGISKDSAKITVEEIMGTLKMNGCFMKVDLEVPLFWQKVFKAIDTF